MIFSNKIFKYLKENPEQLWLINGSKETSCSQVIKDVDSLKIKLENILNVSLKKLIVGIAIKTSYEFILSDLLCLFEDAVSLPVPLDFDDSQIRSLLQHVDIVLVKTDSDLNRINSILPDKPVININKNSTDKLQIVVKGNHALPKNIIKIIHTSGTTTSPKGVLIKDESLSILVDKLLSVFPQHALKYASFLPMSLLVEQIFAIYCTLLTGGKLAILPDHIKEFGSHFDKASVYLDFICHHLPNFLYFPPMLLEDLKQSDYLEKISKEGFYITGGAKINHATLQDLDKKGIKIYEGYGLSETTSVVSINGLIDRKIGTAGKILPHLNYKIVNHELLLKGSTLCGGYFNKDESSCKIDKEGYLHTGDLVEVDQDRYLTIKGRKKNLLILSNARNISPEWVEDKLKKFDEIEDCVILGEGQAYLTALILSNKTWHIESQINAVNSELPAFAKIKNFICIADVNQFRKKYFTVTGRPRRSLIHMEYKNEL